MRGSSIIGVALASFILTGCSEMSMPTSPSATVLASGPSGSGQTSLNWDATAPSCAPDRPLPDVAGEPTHSRALTANEQYFQPGAVVASWTRETDTVWAIFYPAQSGHALCLWDTAGL
ncbi:MAG: hypothetical protein Q8N52_11930 [Acidobacteriota bacterium]|nr:hypothetical protein [Acidobacteriota bacterium]